MTLLSAIRYARGQAWRAVAQMLACVMLVALLAVMAVGPVAAANEQPTAKRMKVSVWPEYDEPRVLVIYEGEFADSGSFPRKVSFRLPAGADINQVCALKTTGEHLCQLYETEKDATGATITYDLPIPTFFLEFYYNPIQGAGQRSIPYEFTPLSPIDTLTLEVQQPARATNFVLTPQASSTQSDTGGLKYHLTDYTKVAPNSTIKATVTYGKPDDKPSTEKKEPQQSGAGPSRADSFGSMGMIFGFGAVAVVGVVGFSAYNRRWRHPLPAPAHGTLARPSAAPRALPGPVARDGDKRGKGIVSFCASCGEHVGPTVRFCPYCGEPVARR
ncbi:MAG: zinc ribbon domain-containing protein [Chloroflexota bacterium]